MTLLAPAFKHSIWPCLMGAAEEIRQDRRYSLLAAGIEGGLLFDNVALSSTGLAESVPALISRGVSTRGIRAERPEPAAF